MSDVNMKVALVLFLTFVIVLIMARLLIYFGEKRRSIQIDPWMDRGSPSISPSASVTVSASPTASPSVSVSPSQEDSGYIYFDGDAYPSVTNQHSRDGFPEGTVGYVDPYPSSAIYYRPNPIRIQRFEDPILIREDRNGRQYIVGTKREEDDTVFSPSPQDRPKRKLDE